MQIQKIEKFKVGNREFSSEQEAEEFFEKQQNEYTIFKLNEDKLEQYDGNYVPVVIDENVDIFFKMRINSVLVWESIIGEENLRYVDFEIQIVDWPEWFEHFKTSNCVISVRNFDLLIQAILNISEGQDVDYKEVLEILADCDFEPEYALLNE